MIMRLSSKGAESFVYSTIFMGRDCMLKRRIAKRYRVPDLDKSMRISRTRSEARIMGAVSGLGINSPRVILVDRYDILMERINGANLNEIMQHRRTNGFGRIFSTLGEYAAALHNNDIVHGDYTPANVMIGNGNSVYLIDFGLSETSNSIEEKALDLLLMKRSISTTDYSNFIKRYKNKAKNAHVVLMRLDEIEKRGRYNTRTLTVN